MKAFVLLLAVVTLLGCSESEIIERPEENVSAKVAFIDSVNAHFYKIYSQDFNLALRLTRQAVQLAQEIDRPEFEANALKNFAVIAYMTGDYQNAVQAGLKSYAIYEELNDKSGLARMSNELGNFVRKQGDSTKAVNYWMDAIQLASESGDQEALGTAYGMLSTHYWLLKDFAKADSLLYLCYEIRLAQNDSVGLGYIYVDFADMERRKGNLEGALEYFEQSNTIRRNIGDWQGLVDNFKMLGDLYRQENDWQNAISYYERTAAESTELGYPDLRRKSLDSLGKIYSYLGDYEEAFHYQLLSRELQDSLFGTEKRRMISEFETKYETEKKEQQIALQTAEIQQQQAMNQRNLAVIGGLVFIVTLLVVILLLLRSRTRKKQELMIQETETKLREAQLNATISSQEKERSRFAKDLHDGFGQMISILNLNLKSLNTGQGDRHEIFEHSTHVLDEMYRELKSICFNLMPQTLIRYGLKEALNEFATRINTTDKLSLETQFFGLDQRLNELQEISIYRISQEWINNILKYSDATRVDLQITRDEEEVTLTIEDNGMGFDRGLLQNDSGNGWRNMNSRANLIKGELHLDTQPGMKGNTLILNAPVQLEQPVIAEMKIPA